MNHELRHRSARWWLRCAGVICLIITAGAVRRGNPATSRESSRQRPAAAELFDFRSNPWVNLHLFLYETARARRGLDKGRLATTLVSSDTNGFGALPAAERAAWERSVDYYMRSVADRDALFDSSMVDITNKLSELAPDAPVGTARLSSALTRALEEAAPAYRALWWPRHDAANRAWIAAVRPLLIQFGDSAAARESRAFDAPWPTRPVRVDVSAYTTWAGAYTTLPPVRIHISSVDPALRGTEGFETLFHEVLHAMDQRLFTRFDAAARAARKHLGRDPTHAFIFYTAGAVTTRLIPGHVPYAEATGLWARTHDLDGMRPLLAEYWQPWLDGRGTQEDALRRIAAALPR